jgi:hypothetical protein
MIDKIGANLYPTAALQFDTRPIGGISLSLLRAVVHLRYPC